MKKLFLLLLIIPSLCFGQETPLVIDEAWPTSYDLRGTPMVCKDTLAEAVNCDSDGNLQIDVLTLPSAGTGVHDEDSAHTSGDEGVQILGIVSAGHAALAADGDYTSIALSQSGEPRVTTKIQEDEGLGSADDVFVIGAMRDDILEANADVDTDEDAVYLRTDNYGALWTAPIVQRIAETDVLTVTAGAYTAKDVVGGEQSITCGRGPMFSCVIRSITVKDEAQQQKNLRVHFFDADPASNIADNGAFDPSDADMDLYAGNCTVSSHMDFTDNSVSVNNNCDLHLDAAAATVYYYIEALEAPTYAHTDDVQITFVIEQD